MNQCNLFRMVQHDCASIGKKTNLIQKHIKTTKKGALP